MPVAFPLRGCCTLLNTGPGLHSHQTHRVRVGFAGLRSGIGGRRDNDREVPGGGLKGDRRGGSAVDADLRSGGGVAVERDRRFPGGERHRRGQFFLFFADKRQTLSSGPDDIALIAEKCDSGLPDRGDGIGRVTKRFRVVEIASDAC